MSEISQEESVKGFTSTGELATVVKWAAAIYGYLTIMATLLGFYYHKGWMQAYGINTDLFPISLQDALVLSHQAFLSTFIVGANNLLLNYDVLLKESIVAGLLVTVVMVIAIRFMKNESKQKDTEGGRFKSMAGILKSLSLLSGLVTALLMYFGLRILVVVISVFGVLPVFGYNNAIKDAKEQQKQSTCSMGSAKVSEDVCDVLILKTDTKDKRHEGRRFVGDVVAANEKWVAISTNNKTLVFSVENAEIQFHRKK